VVELLRAVMPGREDLLEFLRFVRTPRGAAAMATLAVVAALAGAWLGGTSPMELYYEALKTLSDEVEIDVSRSRLERIG